MKVLIQKVKGEFSNLNFFQANKGFEELGYHIEYFDLEQLKGMELHKEAVVVGGIPVMNLAYDKLGVTRPIVPTYPAELRRYLGRKVELTPLGDIRNRVCFGNEAIFIKPVDEGRKLFTGHVVAKMRDLIRTAHIPGNTCVWTSAPVSFETEYRVFIRRGKILGAKHYRGDFRKIVNFDVVEQAKDLVDGIAIAYCLDFGTINGFSTLVEANDSNAMGTYGLHPVDAASMIADRWNEVVGNPID